VFRFLGKILIPFGYFDDEVARPVRDALAPQARLRGEPWRFVELIEFRVGRFVAGLEAFVDDDVARGARANSAASVIGRRSP